MDLTDIAFLQSEQILIPFLFVLAIVFGVLELTNVFKNRAVNFLIALAISIFTISNTFFVSVLWSQFGNITAFFIIMFFIAFVFEVFGLRKKGPHESGGDALIINGVVLFIILAVSSFNMDLIPTLPIIGSAENLLLLVGVVFVLAIFWAAYKTTDKPNSKQ